MAQVKSGLRLALATLIFIGVAFMFVAGMGFAFFPNEHSRILGWFLLIISTTVMALEVNRWIKVLPGILAYAVLNGVIVLSTGHALGSRFVPMAGLPSLVVTLFFAVSAALTVRFAKNRLTRVDRIAAFVYVFILGWLMGYESTTYPPTRVRPLDYLGMGAGIGCLLIAWAYDRNHNRRAHGSGRRVTPGTQGVTQAGSR
jgi:hypothetical protein